MCVVAVSRCVRGPDGGLCGQSGGHGGRSARRGRGAGTRQWALSRCWDPLLGLLPAYHCCLWVDVDVRGFDYVGVGVGVGVG